VVPVPSNPEALVGAKDAGINLDVLYKWATEALDMLACKTSARCELESVWKTLANPQIQIKDYQSEVIDEALELASMDDGFKKTLMVGLTGIDLETEPEVTDDVAVLERDGGIIETASEGDVEEVRSDDGQLDIEISEPEPDPTKDDPGDQLVELEDGSLEIGDLRKAIKEEIRTTMTSVHGRLPD
jgi:hypothetical protein